MRVPASIRERNVLNVFFIVTIYKIYRCICIKKTKSFKPCETCYACIVMYRCMAAGAKLWIAYVWSEASNIYHQMQGQWLVEFTSVKKRFTNVIFECLRKTVVGTNTYLYIYIKMRRQIPYDGPWRQIAVFMGFKHSATQFVFQHDQIYSHALYLWTLVDITLWFLI